MSDFEGPVQVCMGSFFFYFLITLRKFFDHITKVDFLMMKIGGENFEQKLSGFL